MDRKELFDFLEHYSLLYNQSEFIENDPIQIPHQFSSKEDIEIAGFLAASIAWGQRPLIIRNANKLMERMDYAPADFVRNSVESDWEVFAAFKHRTFQAIDMQFFIRSLQNIYLKHGGLEKVFEIGFLRDAKSALIRFNRLFNEVEHLPRSEKHLSNPAKNSAAKRLNMFLRWMIRQDSSGVDFGLWKNIPMSKLMLPLDVHTGRIGRELALLSRKQNDWKAVVEITKSLGTFNPEDPVKYDFALFGFGVHEKGAIHL
ncbi:MAG: TIGR02757 family protein [Bacteroidales bacterium]|nr:TIGR02757 family protein [Bacteroidales bacterium]